MKRTGITIAAALLALALPGIATAQHDHGGHAIPAPRAEQKDQIFVSYEKARQALINGSLPNVQKAAKAVGAAARRADQLKLAELAMTLEKAEDLESARVAFGVMSDEAIKYLRETRSRGDKPVVAYCAMEKKSGLQPGGDIGNPYVDASMRKCGEITRR